MAHPLKAEVDRVRSQNNAEGVKGHNAKLRKLTDHYGAADPAMYKTAKGDLKNGPQSSIGFGVDPDQATSPDRSDRPRRSMAANPIATYKRGGRVHERQKAEERACGGEVPARAFGGAVSGRARGGRKKKGATNVNIVIAQPLPGNTAPPQPPVIPPMGVGAPGGPAGAPKPPMAPPGAGPMPPPPPGLPPPGMVPPRKRGGRVGEVEASVKPKNEAKRDVIEGRARGGKVHEDAAQDAAEIRSMVKASALKHRARGGTVLKGAGADSGEGRLAKSEHMHQPIEGEEH